jgi:N-acetylglucosaminyldiphosphoundecaprenol N-acetyl-beta-D-mannosaminyltransferase
MTGRVNILGVGVSALNMGETLEVIDRWIGTREGYYVTVTGVHGIVESYRDAQVRRIHNEAGLVTPDGMPLVWISWLKGFRHVDRVYGPDLMSAVCRHSKDRGYRHFLFGGASVVLEQLRDKLRFHYPGLEIVGMYSPPYRPMTEAEDEMVVETINRSAPDIVWVGLSTPKQERWMASHVERLSAPVLIGVGAAFDYLAGAKNQAPRWIQRSGFEWLFRLAVEPRRLWKRYLVNNPLFILLVLQQFLGLKRYEVE